MSGALQDWYVMASVRQQRFPNHARTPSLGDLSSREREVLIGIVRGLTNKDIGVQLGISHRTVETHRSHLMRKLNVKTMAGLLTVALPLRKQLENPAGN
jgi:DNA-binding NarL/FixJ family response regulator